MAIESVSLSALNKQIKCTLNNTFTEPQWVVAEISEMHINRNGHCYLELIEKNENTSKTMAKARATIWSFVFGMIKSYFESTTGHVFTKEIKILVQAKVEFHEIYGLSLNIVDIDPTYTLGDIARKRAETIARLEKDGVMDMNKELHIPLVPQRIAVISSATAAGFDDFLNQLYHNPYHYKFHHKLFPAVMQGDKAVDSIIAALEQVYMQENEFDVVVLLRGGGSKSDLSCFDEYELALNVAQFPMPVITGIGHERDQSVTDLVANTRAKTPTAAAEFIVSRVLDFDSYLNQLQEHFTQKVQNIIDREKSRLELISTRFSPLVKNLMEKKKSELSLYHQKMKASSKSYLHNKKSMLEQLQSAMRYKLSGKFATEQQKLAIHKNTLHSVCKTYIATQKHKLEIAENTCNHLNPQNILERGYSITSFKGNILKNTKQLQKNDVVETQLADGVFKSRVE